VEFVMKRNACPLVQAGPSVGVMLATLLVLWTAYWLPSGWAHLKAESLVVQNGFGGDGVQMWELFDLKMTVAYTVVRWLPGVVMIGGVWWWLRRRRRSAGEAAAGSGASDRERPMAA
jgi:hypothetical protein